jgi:protein-tyrosine phosphatase
VDSSSFYPIADDLPGRLSIMPRPAGGSGMDTALRSLRDAGVDVVVCLLTGGERRQLDLADEHLAAARAGLEFHHFPVRDFGVPDHDAIEPLLDQLSERLAAGRHVVVHCRGGVGRSSTVAAALLLRRGRTPDQAWAALARGRGVRVPETFRQRRWVRRHARHYPR